MEATELTQHADPPDTELARRIAAAAAGSPDALAWLYHAYVADVHRIAARLSGSIADAEDIVQDIFVGLPFALRRYAEHGRFAHWLGRITVRTTLNRLRARGRRAEIDIAAIADLHDPSTERHEAQRQLVDAISKLPPALREVFVLHELEGYSHQDIAELREISVSASTMRLHRAWRLLRRHGH